jgi:DNA-binding transcriptional MerR regulator
MQTLAIGELARQTGLSQSAIRYYEAEGLLQKPQRSSGWRMYPPDAVDRVRVIQMARALGFTLAEVRTLLLGFSDDTPPSGLRCDCVTVQDCILYDCNPPVTLTRRK